MWFLHLSFSRKFTRNEEFIAKLQLVMIPIGITLTVWKLIENIMVWFGHHEINFGAYLIYWIYSGPRHTTNPSTLRKFWVQKITYKKLMNFSEKIHWYFKTTLHLLPKHLRRHYPLKIRPDFDLKELENFLFQKIWIFWSFSDIFKFHLQ